MRTFTFDFETRSELDLTLVGAYEYSRHPSTEVLCFSYWNGEKIIQWAKIFEDKNPPDSFSFTADDVMIKAHNAEFEYCIYNNTLRRQFPNLPKLPISRFTCTAMKAAVFSMPRKLEGLAKVLKTEVQKDKEGHRVMLKLSQPRRETKNNKAKYHEDPGDWFRLLSYNKDDVLAEMQCDAKLPELSRLHQKCWEYSVVINERGMLVDKDLCRIAIDFANQHESELTEELKLVTGGLVNTVNQHEKIKHFLNMNGVLAESTDKKAIEELLKKEDIPWKAKRVLEIRQAIGGAAVKKFSGLYERLGVDNRIRGTLVYHAASTGRFAGKGFQPQNIARGSIKDTDSLFKALAEGDFEFFKMIYPDVFRALTGAIRGMIIAGAGKKLVAGDFNAIETRVLFWLCDEEQGVEAFRNDEDLYKFMASDIFQKAIGLINDDERFVGKQAVLGCGYMMGFAKFILQCAGFGKVVSEELAKKAVYSYRNKFKNVVQFWRDIENACVAVVKFGQPVSLKGLTIYRSKDFLHIRLPSGRDISYFKPFLQLVDSPYGVKETLHYYGESATTRQWAVEKTFGGKLTENIVQAISFDLMMYSMVQLEKAGFPIVLTVHDEAVSECDENKSLDDFKRVMQTPPAWAHDLPLKVGAWEGQRYKK